MNPLFRDGIMDYLRVLLVPFNPACLIMVAIASVLLALFGAVGLYGMLGTLIVQVWVFKYCYVLIEDLADGKPEPPVLSTDMLSPLEIRPWVQLFIIAAAFWTCWLIGGRAGLALGVFFLALFPASVGILGFGERPWQAVNPLTLFRVIRGLGPHYLILLAAMLVYAVISLTVRRISPLSVITHAVDLLLEISFFALIGGALYMRRKQLGYEPTNSPERREAREENERTKLRAKMVDDIFQQVRLGKNVDATKPLAGWLRDLDGEYASRDALFVAEQAVRWDYTAALNPIGSTLIRHLLRAGRPDSALSVFQVLRARASTFTMDSADDLRTLADYADSKGYDELATSMRMETPVFQPRR